MKKSLIFFFTLTLLFIFAQPAHACEPCLEVLTLEETAAVADLVIIGKKVKNGPNVNGGGIGSSPDWIEVKVIEVLKGEIEETTIKVNSWNGMCAYGIVIEDKGEHLIFLQKVDPSTHDGIQYDAVEWGCAVTRYPIEDDIVIKEYEEQRIPLDEFLALLELERKEPEPTEKENTKDTEGSTGMPLCTGWMLFLPLAGIIWKKSVSRG
jgi:hypothetical protein